MRKNQSNSSILVGYRLVTTQRYYPVKMIKTAYLNGPQKSQVVVKHKLLTLSKAERSIGVAGLTTMRAVEMYIRFGEVTGLTFPWFGKSRIRRNMPFVSFLITGVYPPTMVKRVRIGFQTPVLIGFFTRSQRVDGAPNGSYPKNSIILGK